ncbi:acyltransferase family protein [Terriglobus roseus]|uniref:acyltransferase family protein n=1 Tax=Terriglobus roseus TaxID=392734 RepID=UPI0009420FE2|nr:acyltransferase [Terriglobus roseus]
MTSSELGGPRRHYRALDGLRAVAALSVIYYHSAANGIHLPISQLAWVGVDLFFVLSGFLITGVLLKTRETSNYFRVFYGRRALRIFPIYYAALAAIFCAHFVLPHYPVYPWTTQVWYWINASNFPTAIALAGVTDLTHFWTLAIEEQFYLLWPLLVYNLRNRTLLYLCMLALPVEYALRLLPTVARLNAITDNQFSYRLTPLHSEGLFAGAAIAILLSEEVLGPSTLKMIRRIAASAGVLALLSVRWNTAPQWIVASRFSLLAVAFAAFVAMLAVGPAESLPARALSSGLLRKIGRMSFSIYVIHLPIMNFLKSHVFGYPSTKIALLDRLIVSLLVTVGCASAAWWAIEEPCLAMKRFFLYRSATETGTRTEYAPSASAL